MKYNDTDFLEQFDAREEFMPSDVTIYQKYGIINTTDYANVTLYYYENDKVHIDINSVDVELEKIQEIICEKKEPEIVRFLFFKHKQNVPIAILTIKPKITLQIYTSQQKSAVSKLKMQYDAIDFLEHFDESYPSRGGYNDYFIRRNNYYAKVSLSELENKVFFDVNSVQFCLTAISRITFNKTTQGAGRFLFYRYGEEHPIVILYIASSIGMIIDMEQIGG